MLAFFKWFFGDPRHGSQSFLRGVERRAIAKIVDALPARVRPAQLSGIGALGAVLAAAALIWSKSAPLAMCVVPLAMAVNWFGLSVDLPLARRRDTETPAEGMAHHLGEIFSHVSLLIAYGFSPFLTLRSAEAVVVCYLLFASYAYIRAATRHVDQMAYLGIGVTEFRLLLAFWPFAAVALGVPESRNDALPAIDVAILSLVGFAIAGLLVKFFWDGRKITLASERDD